MPVQFVRLQIAGFKSFADPVSVEILPGLTGIVGPNGCGKSNVVEALRWAMGESSARSLRGGGMDDLIFAGTAARPARDMAEVILTLEGAGELASSPFHDQTELRISRRIERGGGSTYRVNGRELRARDVQVLFAGLASGARSSAMVSQGRVAAIVDARPDERRSVLEEAAGITGLQARRHEAELKLRATEANLARAEDLRLQLDARVRSLAEQAGQAGRYRGLVSQLHACEATLLALLHAQARAAVTASSVARSSASGVLEQAGQRLLQAEVVLQAAEADLPARREAAMQARAALERQHVEADGAARDGERAAQALERSELRRRQAAGHRDEAAARLADAQDATARLDAEIAALDEAASTLPLRRAEQEAGLETLRADLREAEQTVRSTIEAAVTAKARAAEAAREGEAAAGRLERTAAILLQIDVEQARRHAALPAPDLLLSHEAARAEAADALEQARRERDAASQARAIAVGAAETAKIEDADNRGRRHAATLALRQAEARAERLAAECQTLRTRLRTAEAELMSEVERAATGAAVTAATDALARAAEVLEAAQTVCGAAVSARLEAWSRLQEAGHERAQVEAARNAAEAAQRHAIAQHERLSDNQARSLVGAVPADTMAAACRARAQAEADLADAEVHLAKADATHDAATDAAAQAAMQLGVHREAYGRLQAEAEGLTQALADEDGGPDLSWQSLADQLAVPQDLEAAFAACLGEGLEAACAAEAPRAWLELPAITAVLLPHGVVALDSLVDTPAPLRRALSRAGLIEDGQDGGLLQAELQPGQCLVTRSGALWRWDGYRTEAGVPSQAALRLRQRRRLHDTRGRLAAMEAGIMPAEAEAARCMKLHDQAAAVARLARTSRARAEQALAGAREEESRLGRRDAETRAQLDGLRLQLGHAAAVRAETKAALDRIRNSCATLADTAALAQAHEAARQREVEAAAAAANAQAVPRDAEVRLQQARDAATAVLGQHARSETICAALTPLLARTQDEADAAELDRVAAQEALTALPVADAEAALQARMLQAEAAARREQAAQDAYREAQARLSRCAAAREQVAAARLEGLGRLEALGFRREAVQAEQDEASRIIEAREQAAALLADPLQAAAAAASASDRLASLREAERSASAAYAPLAMEQAALDAKHHLLALDRADWRTRRSTAEDLLAAAGGGLAAAQAEQAQRAADLAEAERRAESLASELEAARSAHQAAQDALDGAEATLLQARLAQRVAGTELARAREAALRAEAREAQAQAVLAQLLADTPHPPAAFPDDRPEATEASLRRQIARLTRECDEAGPVNLRADLELREAEAQIAAIRKDRDEIQGAVARLRGQIGQINRDGRERLMTVFDAVDQHFGSLFTRMFGGGRAHLGMVGSDDPLTAGLEIYAQPPGKKLATLSLLSGGEQALTALSLIFAVFRCNPAPICVLDEVDAPLDDANVMRFCTLLQDMVREAGTRFLVVTHHQLTMAHADRLYGVTMPERGVSRVLSVDLDRAAAIAG